MRKRRPLTERQQRVISKVGLLPLISFNEVSKRTGIPRGQLERVIRPNPTKLSTRYALMEKYRQKPETRWILDHPKLWALARLAELAPHQSIPKIRAQLLEEARQRNMLEKSRRRKGKRATWHRRYTVLAKNELYNARRKFGLATPEQITAISSKSNRKRSPNSLSDSERQKLFEHGLTVLNIALRLGRPPKNTRVDPAVLQEALEKRLMQEVRYFDPRGATGDRLRIQWEKFVLSRYKYFLVDALYKVGPYKRNGTLRSELNANEFLKNREGPPAPNEPFEAPLPNRPLTPQEGKALRLLQSGASRKEIARDLNISMPRIHHILKDLRGAFQ